MNIPNGLTLVVENRQNKVRKLGNSLLDPKETENVHFASIRELKFALRLEKEHEIRIHTNIPEDVLALLNLPEPEVGTVHPDAPSGLFYRDEFMRFNEIIVDGLTDKAPLATVNELVAIVEGKAPQEIVDELTTTVEGFTASLADKVELAKMNKSLINPPARNVQALVSFVLDDGTLEDYTKIFPLFNTKGVPGVSAVISSRIGTPNYMPHEQIKEMEDRGWEIASHSVNHPNFETVTDEQAKYEINESSTQLRAMGYDVKNIVYPFGSVTKAQKKYVSSRYNTGVDTRGGVNIAPMDLWALKRVALGSYFDSAEAYYKSYQYYQDKVDDAIAKQGWLIFMLHPAAPDHDATQQQYLSDIIDYIQINNVKVVTLEQGLELNGSLVHTGNTNLGDADDYFVVTPNGRPHSSYFKGQSITVYDTDSNTAPTEILAKYPDMTITKSIVLLDGMTGLPEVQAGTLITYVPVRATDTMYQLWYPYLKANVYIRYVYQPTDSWKVWSKMSDYDSQMFIALAAANAHTVDTLPTAFTAGKITYTPISGTNMATFPEAKAGMLTTTRINSDNSYAKQEYKIVNSHVIYERTATSGNIWLGWFKRPVHVYAKATALVFGTIPANSAVESTYTVTGATASDTLLASVGGLLETGLMYNAWVSANHTVRVRMFNLTAAPIVVADKVFNIMVYKN
jgi:peptidoglycan/xylan/chitin deacetylase (PgdA/CDA1 family)